MKRRISDFPLIILFILNGFCGMFYGFFVFIFTGFGDPPCPAGVDLGGCIKQIQFEEAVRKNQAELFIVSALIYMIIGIIFSSFWASGKNWSFHGILFVAISHFVLCLLILNKWGNLSLIGEAISALFSSSHVNLS